MDFGVITLYVHLFSSKPIFDSWYPAKISLSHLCFRINSSVQFRRRSEVQRPKSANWKWRTFLWMSNCDSRWGFGGRETCTQKQQADPVLWCHGRNHGNGQSPKYSWAFKWDFPLPCLFTNVCLPKIPNGHLVIQPFDGIPSEIDKGNQIWTLTWHGSTGTKERILLDGPIASR